MIQNRPLLTMFTHGFLIAALIVISFPLYIALVASTIALPGLVIRLRNPIKQRPHKFDNRGGVFAFCQLGHNPVDRIPVAWAQSVQIVR